jgi:hypothetical protein
MKLKRTYWFKLALILMMLVLAIGASYIPVQVTTAQVGGQLSYGTSAFGAISASAPSVTYSFTGAAGDLVQVDVKGLAGGLDPSVDLIGPDQQVLASSQRNRLAIKSQDAYIAAFLPQAGVYNLLVSGIGGTAGDFALRLHGRGPVASTPLIYGEAVEVTIPQNAPSQYFTFTAEDCPTTLTVTNLSDGEPLTFPFVVKVRNEQGREIALLKGGDAQEDRVTVAPLSGQYEIEVLADDPLLTGLVSLLVTCAENAPGCQGGDETAGPACLPCPDCATVAGGPGETGPACPEMNFTTVPAEPGITFTWSAVPGADFYWLHIYGLHGDGEVYLGAAGVPGDATDYHLDHLFDGFWGFRFVLEAVQGETVICSDETEILRAERGPTCDNFTVTGRVDSHVDRTVTWTWDAYPGAEMYVGTDYFTLPDGSEVPRHAAYEAATTSVTRQYELDDVPGDIVRFQIDVIIGDEIICTAEDTIEFEHEGPTEVEWPDCEQFVVSLTEQTDSTATISWTEYPVAEQYWFYILDEDGMMVPGYPAFLPPSQLSTTVELTPGTYTIGVAPWVTPDGAICLQGLTVTQEGTQTAATCLIRADRGDVRVHVGPGRGRSVFTFLTAHREYVVIGQALDDDGNLWWQIDKTQIPGHEAVISLWVAEADVFEIGDCQQVPEGDIPPIIPDDGGEPPGTWLPCGSCDTCGHPANECVTSPTGECLWDPATCAQQPPPEDGGGDDGGEPGDGGGDQTPQCVTVTASVDPAGTGSAGPITSGNCISEIAGIYLPGTNVQVQVNENPGCWLDHWSGCGASGAANPVSFTVTSSCHITAHMQCIQ